MTSGAGDTRNETPNVRELQSRIDVAREIHHRRTWRGHPIQRFLWSTGGEPLGLYDEFCWTCRAKWPCATVVALDGVVAEVVRDV